MPLHLTMQVTFRQWTQRLDPEPMAHVHGKLTTLRGLIAIDSAGVISRRTVGRPPGTATAQLAVPGPDLRADGRGYAQQAALERLFSGLGQKTRSRRSKSPDRRKGRALRPGAPTRTVSPR